MIDIEKWVKQNLGRKGYFDAGYTDIQVRVVGYDRADNRAILEIIDDRFIDIGWTYIAESDIIMASCPDGATLLYAKLENIKLKPKAFGLPATETLDALEEITRNFAQRPKATASDLKEIKRYVSTLKSKIYGLE